MFNDAEISVRRDAKRRAVELLVTCAEKFPATTLTGEAILGTRVVEIAMPLGDFWRSLTAPERTALGTGKGCNTRPAGATNYHETTLRDFLRKGAEHPYRDVLSRKTGKMVTDEHGVTCWGGYLKDGWAWAKQVIDKNPNAFPSKKAKLEGVVNRVTTALDREHARTQEDRVTYIANPSSPPTFGVDVSKSVMWYYLAWVAGEIFEAAEAAGGATILKKGGSSQYVAQLLPRDLDAARTAFNAKLRALDTDLSQCARQQNNESFDKAFNRWAHWYRHRDVTLDDFDDFFDDKY